MRRVIFSCGITLLFTLSGGANLWAQAPLSSRALLDKYCVNCHSDRLKTGGLTLEKIDAVNLTPGAETWEKVIRKLRAGAMPPAGVPRPEPQVLASFTNSLETSLDRIAAANPNPGRATVHRLNRTEYGNAIRDLLGLEIDPAAYLPADDENYGFDNIADVLKTSPALLERYLTASRKISRLAVGDMSIIPDTQTYRAKPDLGQDRHIDGLPLGTRGGIQVRHTFPLDGTYVIRVHLARNTSEAVRGLDYPNDTLVMVDGALVHKATIGGREDEDALDENTTEASAAVENRLMARVTVKAGSKPVAITFRQKTRAQVDGVMQPYLRSNVDPLEQRGIPLVDNITITGPFDATGPGDTESRRKIFICRPTSKDEVPCAKKILTTLARRAYRRPVSESETELLLGFYQRGRNEGGSFDAGIESALRLILTNPKFLFRSEADPANAVAESTRRLTDLELASRLSFFLWSSVPDETLLSVAMQGKLKEPAILEQQVRRMLADKRSRSLITNFAGQWLYLRNLPGVTPNIEEFPDFDDNLRQGFLRETEMLIESVVREDRSVVDLLTADYTFVNERLARHYGIPEVYGSRFRRVVLADQNRRGLLGQGSILTVTSYATRTSPVQRGKWILENILGTPPAPPPPNVPSLKDKADAGRPTTLRQRMEEHRQNPACAVCHRVMDPLGFSLENFDAIGQWRMQDTGKPIDATGQLADGTAVEGPVSLRQALVRKPENFVGTMTERMLTYALGRGLEYYDMPSVRSVVREAAKNNNRFSAVVLGIVKSPPFQTKKVAAKETAATVASK